MLLSSPLTGPPSTTSPACPKKNRTAARTNGTRRRNFLMPPGQYRVIYADPPWKYGDERAGLEGYSDTAAAAQYPAGEVAGELYSVQAVAYSFDGEVRQT